MDGKGGPNGLRGYLAHKKTVLRRGGVLWTRCPCTDGNTVGIPTAISVDCPTNTCVMQTETSRQPTSWWTAKATSKSATSALRYPFLLSTSSLENSLLVHYWEIQYWFMTGKLISFPLLGNSLLVHYWETTDSVPSSAPSFN